MSDYYARVLDNKYGERFVAICRAGEGRGIRHPLVVLPLSEWKQVVLTGTEELEMAEKKDRQEKRRKK